VDKIDDVDFYLDGGYGEYGNQTKAFLSLEGDFVETFQNYLDNEDATRITLEISRSDAEKLIKLISEYI